MIKNTKADRGEIHLLPSIRFLLFTETVYTVPHKKSVLPMGCARYCQLIEIMEELF